MSAILACPQCGAAIRIRAAGLSMSCACGNCGSIGQLREPIAAKIRTRHLAWNVAPSSAGKVQIDAMDFEGNQSVRF